MTDRQIDGKRRTGRRRKGQQEQRFVKRYVYTQSVKYICVKYERETERERERGKGAGSWGCKSTFFFFFLMWRHGVHAMQYIYYNQSERQRQERERGKREPGSKPDGCMKGRDLMDAWSFLVSLPSDRHSGTCTVSTRSDSILCLSERPLCVQLLRHGPHGHAMPCPCPCPCHGQVELSCSSCSFFPTPLLILASAIKILRFFDLKHANTLKLYSLSLFQPFFYLPLCPLSVSN